MRTREHPSLKHCTCDWPVKPTWANPFVKGRESCGREMVAVVTKAGTFWRCESCDVVYAGGNKRKADK